LGEKFILSGVEGSPAGRASTPKKFGVFYSLMKPL